MPELRDLVRKNDRFLRDSFYNYTGSHVPLPHISFTTEDVTRLQMGWRAYEFDEKSYRGAILPRCEDWPNIDDVLDLGLVLIFAPIIYGGLHALAWFAHFGSFYQQLLWRISTCVVMGGVPVCSVLLWLSEPTNVKKGFFDSIYNFTVYYSIALALSALAYPLARAYLVVECFINLSHLPAGVYDVPQWASYFPHIS